MKTLENSDLCKKSYQHKVLDKIVYNPEKTVDKSWNDSNYSGLALLKNNICLDEHGLT